MPGLRIAGKSALTAARSAAFSTCGGGEELERLTGHLRRSNDIKVDHNRPIFTRLLHLGEEMRTAPRDEPTPDRSVIVLI